MRVLVVEDEHRLAAGVRAGLEAAGLAVDVALDGTDGLWRAREHPYDAIVLDLMLPGMNGFKVCRTLREEGIWTPILVLTAKDGEWDQVEALDTAARRAWRGDVEIELTARELSLLELFLRRRGEVISKRDVLASVWDDDFEGD